MALYLIIFLILMIVAIFHIICTFIASKYSGKYFDNEFIKQRKSVPLVFYFMGSAKYSRTHMYLASLLFGKPPFLKHYSKKCQDRHYNNIGGVDYRKVARKSDWVWAYVCEIPFVVFWILFIVLCVYHPVVHATH